MENKGNNITALFNRLARENIPISPFWTLRHTEYSYILLHNLSKGLILYPSGLVQTFLGSFLTSCTQTLVEKAL